MTESCTYPLSGSDKTLCFRDCKFSPDGQHLYTIQTKSRSDSYLTKWSTKKWQVRMPGCAVGECTLRTYRFIVWAGGLDDCLAHQSVGSVRVAERQVSGVRRLVSCNDGIELMSVYG